MARVKKASVQWIEDHNFEASTASGHKFLIDSSGTNRGPDPMELVLVGLAGCTAMDVIDILKKKRLHVKGLEVRVEGTRVETYPMVYECIDVIYMVRGKNIPPSDVEHAIKLSEEKYCSVGAMLGKTAKINSRYEIIAE